MLRRRDPDREAGCLLTEIYRDHAAGAYRYAYHLTRSREDADDIVQAVFLALHQALLRGETIVSPGAFLATAVKRRAINLAVRRRTDPDSAGIERTAAPAVGADAASELARIQALLFTLPQAQHQAFVLRHWSGLSNREIAGVLATTEPAVESLLVRARSALMAAAAPGRECAEVCARLAEDRPTPPADTAHISRCRGCRTAQQRLTRAADIAAAAMLLPNVHVAHALAAAVPGFSAGAAAGVTGAGASGATAATAAGSKAGTAMLLAKTGAALVAVTAVTAVGIHAHRTTRPAHAAPATHVVAHTGHTGTSTPSREFATAAAAAAPSQQTDASGATDTTSTVRQQKSAGRDGRDGTSAGDTSSGGGDTSSGSGDTSSGGGDTGTGGGGTSTTSGGDGTGSGQATGSDGGGTDSSSGQSGDGGGSGGSSDTSGSGPGDSGN